MMLRGFRFAAFLAVFIGIALDTTGPVPLADLLTLFTFQSNILYALYAAWTAFRPTAPIIKGALTLYVVISGLVFHLILNNPHTPFYAGPFHFRPAEAVGNQLLHTVLPLLALVDWLVFGPRGQYRRRYAVYWLAGPVAYLVYALAWGAIADTYPYPFIDPRTLGPGGVALSAAGFAVGFWLLGLLLVAIDRTGVRQTESRDEPV
jgi:hypothetical protein